MIIVTGSIVALPERFDELLGLSLAHVQRSRAEPGCIAHAAYHDAEDPNRLVFVEQWADREALLAHFAVPASRAFIKAASACAAVPPAMALFQAEPLNFDPALKA